MPVTLKQIARHLDLSVTQVSRALGGFPDVSTETRTRVEQAAHELGYTPNVFAQRLKKQRTETIGLILPTYGPRFSDPFFSELLAGVGNEANSAGYDILLSTHAPGAEEMRAYQRLVTGRRVDGFLLVRVRQDDARVNFLLENDFAFAAYGRSASKKDYACVEVDSYRGFCEACEHLIGLGHTRIGLIAAPHEFMFADRREAAYRDTLLKHELPLDEHWMVCGDLTQAGGYSAAVELLAVQPAVTAIMAANDLMALGAMGAIQEKGLAVGRDIAVLGFDGLPWGEHSHPPLTTVYQPVYQIARQITRMLVELIEGSKPDPLQVLLQPTLIVRGSTQPAARS